MISFFVCLRTAISASTERGRLRAEWRAGQVWVNMGAAQLDWQDIPLSEATDTDALPIDGNPAAVGMGNPHCVMQVADTRTADVARLGPLVERHERFPDRANAGFMAIRGRDTIDLRVHERGVGETLACGTGACAAVVAGQRLGHLGSSVTASLPGGKLMVSWHGGAETVWLTGNAEFISKGSIDL